MFKTAESSTTDLKHYAIVGAYATLLLSVIAFFTPLISKLSATGADYIPHLKWASDIEQQGALILPHPLYHLLVIGVRHLLSIGFVDASTIVVVLSIFALAVLNFRILKSCCSLKTALLLSFCLLVVTPIQLLYFTDQHLYFGYIGITLYHSPTMLLLKPLSVIVFCCALKAADDPSQNTLKSGLLFAIALFLCGISKPSFLMVVLPAFVMFLLVIQQLKPMLKRPFIYCAFFLPIFSLLSLQFIQTYLQQNLSQGTGHEESHIVIMPFETMSHYSGFLIAKFFLSIAFPLAVFCCYPKASVKDKPMVFSLLCLLVGVILTYVFAESGYRMYSGNFWWSGQIGLYLIFLFSLMFLLRNRLVLIGTMSGKIKFYLCMLMFFFHTVFGLFFFKQELLMPYGQYW